MNQPRGEELRRSPRRPAGWRCFVKSQSRGLQPGRIENASAEGFLIELNETLTKGETVTIKVEVLYGGRRWEFIAQAIARHIAFRTSTCTVGVELTKSQPKDAKFLHDFSYGVI